jgi:trk system potassium uptake protein TrkA
MTDVGICTVAREIEPDVGTVARIDHGEKSEYAGLVDQVVYPEKLAAPAATDEIVHVARGGVQAIEHVTGDLTPLEITVAEDAPVAGRKLQVVALPRGPSSSPDATATNSPARRWYSNPASGT